MNKQTITTIIVSLISIIIIGVVVLKSEKPEETVLLGSEINKLPQDEVLVLEPMEVVQKFIEADMAGARLGGELSKQAPAIKDYFNFPSMSDFAMVIDRYEIIDEYSFEDKNHYFIKVDYFCKMGIASGFSGAEGEEIIQEVLGEIDNGVIVAIPCASFFQYICPRCFEEPNKNTDISFDTQEQIQTVIFELVKNEGQWRLNSPTLSPHISIETFGKYLGGFSKID